MYDHSQARVGSHIPELLTAYTTKMQLHGHDELGILQYISEWAGITNHPGCSHVLSLHSDLELESASTDGRHLSISIITHFTCETYIKATA